MTRHGETLARLAVLALTAGCVRDVRAQEVLGPNKCTTCHDHEAQKTWYEKKEGPKGHLNALAQLEDKRAAAWGKAIGLADVYDLSGACVKCHATVFKKDANAGVSCESCHGAGSGFLEVHQQKDAYKKAVALGMFDTRGNYAVWAKLCLDCHILTDGRLAAAGHPSGKGFDLGEKAFGAVVHWKPSYDRTILATAGRAYVPGKGVPAGAVPAVAVAAAEPPKAAPAAAPKAATAASQTSESRPDPKAPAASTPNAPPRSRPQNGESRPDPARIALAAAPPPVTKEIVNAAPTPPPAPAAPTLVELPPSDTPLAKAAAARGQALLALAAAIKDGKPAVSTPAVPAPPAASRVDAELLRLQDEVLALELSVLKPPAPAEKKK